MNLNFSKWLEQNTVGTEFVDESKIDQMYGKAKKLFTGEPAVIPKGSVTKTEKSVTVAPGKKRGGAC